MAVPLADTPRVGRILRSADFVRALASPACARSTHFAVHFVDGSPSQPAKRGSKEPVMSERTSSELSTGSDQVCQQPVDDLPVMGPVNATQSPLVWWLGAVVPKRHAKRAVTRTLLKRQIRIALAHHAETSGAPARRGLWVVRLRAPFDRAVFASAASNALRAAADGELSKVIGQAGRKLAVALTAG